MTPEVHALLVSLAITLIGTGLLISHTLATRLCIVAGTILAGVVLVVDILALT